MLETNVWCDAEDAQGKHPAKWQIIVRGQERNSIHSVGRYDACPHHLGQLVEYAIEHRMKLITNYRTTQKKGEEPVDFRNLEVQPLDPQAK